MIKFNMGPSKKNEVRGTIYFLEDKGAWFCRLSTDKYYAVGRFDNEEDVYKVLNDYSREFIDRVKKSGLPLHMPIDPDYIEKYLLLGDQND